MHKNVVQRGFITDFVRRGIMMFRTATISQLTNKQEINLQLLWEYRQILQSLRQLWIKASASERWPLCFNNTIKVFLLLHVTFIP